MATNVKNLKPGDQFAGVVEDCQEDSSREGCINFNLSGGLYPNMRFSTPKGVEVYDGQLVCLEYSHKCDLCSYCITHFVNLVGEGEAKWETQ